MNYPALGILFQIQKMDQVIGNLILRQSYTLATVKIISVCPNYSSS